LGLGDFLREDGDLILRFAFASTALTALAEGLAFASDDLHQSFVGLLHRRLHDVGCESRQREHDCRGARVYSLFRREVSST
jgi:hypothetical protein